MEVSEGVPLAMGSLSWVAQEGILLVCAFAPSSVRVKASWNSVWKASADQTSLDLHRQERSDPSLVSLAFASQCLDMLAADMTPLS